MRSLRLMPLTSALFTAGLLMSSAAFAQATASSTATPTQTDSSAMHKAPAKSTAHTGMKQDTSATSNSAEATSSGSTTRHSDDAKSSMGNAAITGKVKAALIADSRTKAFDTNVDTDGNGKVTLSGTAPTQEAKQAAAEVARKVDGVTSVHNRLMVSADRTANPQTMSAKAQSGTEEGWLTTKVKAALTDDKRVSASDVHVETNGSTVTLTGSVDSATAKQAAVERARQVKGVKDVQADGLTVNGQGSTMSR